MFLKRKEKKAIVNTAFETEEKESNKSGSALRLEKITKTYGSCEYQVQALKGIDLSFRKNEFVSILGPSGCGKTTLLNIIGGLDRYTSGDLIINGKSTKDYKDADWDTYRNNSIGFIFQSYNLIPHQTVLKNVELSMTLSGVSSEERKKRAEKVLEEVGLSGLSHKLPNQMSGGQMQRVAIARALVNDPEIILADEPTGALDTETSIQIMDLLKEVAKDRLVIMVTHNPDLAKKYSTRIINLLDGEKTGDTDPYDEKSVKVKKNYKGKSAMKLTTAFALSLSNLRTKKGRTTLTSIAGSIGIIGIALVLAVSTGFNTYMAKMQTETLSSYPLTISESSVDLSTFSDIYEKDAVEKYPDLNNVVVEKAFSKLTGMLKSNKLNDTTENGFKYYLEEHKKNNPDLYYTVSYDYGFDMNDYFFTDITFGNVKTFMSIDTLVRQIESQYNDKLESAIGLNTNFVRQYIPTIQEMPDYNLIAEQYDVLNGKLPTFTDENKYQTVFVVDEYNGISDISLALLGYLGVEFNGTESGVDVTFEDKETISLEDIVGKEMYLADNDDMYKVIDGNTFVNHSAEKKDMKKLEIVGVIRAKKDVQGILKEGIAYMPTLTQEVLKENKDSAVLSTVNQDGKIIVYDYVLDKETGMLVIDTETMKPKTEPTESLTLRQVAGVDTPSEISIYAKDFESKEKIKSYIDSWNDKYSDNEDLQITYSDMMSMMFSMLQTMVNAVKYVLIAFTSISLIVSSIMIGIITYVSVVERTKEIGILRAMGARKKDISRIFNAETFLIGLFAGLIGIAVTYLLSIPINLILGKLIEGIGNIATLRITDAIILVVISFVLTIISGIIPSRIAAKKDPVVALRTE